LDFGWSNKYSRLLKVFTPSSSSNLKYLLPVAILAFSVSDLSRAIYLVVGFVHF